MALPHVYVCIYITVVPNVSFQYGYFLEPDLGNNKCKNVKFYKSNRGACFFIVT